MTFELHPEAAADVTDIWEFIAKDNAARFHAVRNYLIAYAPEERPLLILAVLHGRRSPKVLAAML